MSFSEIILHWYTENKRLLPWRSTKDPYKIWLSEIILQQTRVNQGIPYYHKFLNNYPTIGLLANAKEDEVLKLWQGLGYYSRARNLHKTAQTISFKFKGKFPDNYHDLLKLKGIGDYTASAIASICYDEAKPVVDGNVYRVLSRYFAVDIPINSSKGAKYFKKLAKEVMDPEHIRDYNQGIMEFGALQCTPKLPKCGSCPLGTNCMALHENRISSLPVKLKKAEIRNRYFNYLVIIDGANRTQLRQRRGKGIWENLFEFPLYESKGEIHLKELKHKIPEIVELQEILSIEQSNKESIIHKLSHQHLHTKFWMINTRDIAENGIPLQSLENYPVPVLIGDFIETFKNSYF